MQLPEKLTRTHRRLWNQAATKIAHTCRDLTNRAERPWIWRTTQWSDSIRYILPTTRKDVNSRSAGYNRTKSHGHWGSGTLVDKHKLDKTKEIGLSWGISEEGIRKENTTAKKKKQGSMKKAVKKTFKTVAAKYHNNIIIIDKCWDLCQGPAREDRPAESVKTRHCEREAEDWLGNKSICCSKLRTGLTKARH